MMIWGSFFVFCAQLNLLLVVVDGWRKVRARRRYDEVKRELAGLGLDPGLVETAEKGADRAGIDDAYEWLVVKTD